MAFTVLSVPTELQRGRGRRDSTNARNRAGGSTLLDRVWEGPEMLPSLPEIRDPSLWLGRVKPRAELKG